MRTAGPALPDWLRPTLATMLALAVAFRVATWLGAGQQWAEAASTIVLVGLVAAVVCSGPPVNPRR